MSDNTNRNVVINAIKEKVREEKLIPFVGAGFSANIEGYPSWRRSVEMLEERCSGCKEFTNDFLEAYQYAYWESGKEVSCKEVSTILDRGKKELRKSFLCPTLNKPIERLKRQTSMSLKNELKQHVLLVSNFKKIYTTNWDTLIEFTCNKARIPYKSHFAKIGRYSYGSKYYLNKEISNTSNTDKCVNIIKYHGCVTDKSATSIIASSADYHERISSLYVHPLDQELYWDMREKAIMFIGYSLNDVNIRYVMNQVLFEAWRQPNNPENATFYLIELGKPQMSKVLDYRHDCNMITPVYLFDENHFYHKVVKMKDDIENEKNRGETGWHNNCNSLQWKIDNNERRNRVNDIIATIENRYEHENKDGFLPLKNPDVYKDKLSQLMIINMQLDEGLDEELGELIKEMRREAIIRFLEYITNKN